MAGRPLSRWSSTNQPSPRSRRKGTLRTAWWILIVVLDQGLECNQKEEEDEEGKRYSEDGEFVRVRERCSGQGGVASGSFLPSRLI